MSSQIKKTSAWLRKEFREHYLEDLSKMSEQLINIRVLTLIHRINSLHMLGLDKDVEEQLKDDCKYELDLIMKYRKEKEDKLDRVS